MITISNSPCTCYFTLYENSNNITNPSYSFAFYHVQSQNTYYITGDDMSTSPWYYNQYQFIVATAGSATQGCMVNMPTGLYNYTVYETDIPYSLATSSTIVEYGLLRKNI